MTNSLGLNSLYTVAFAAYSMKNEGDVKKYGKMDELEAYTRVKKYMDVSEFIPGEVPFYIFKNRMFHNQNTMWSSFTRKFRS